MSDFVQALRTAELPEGGRVSLEIQDRYVVLVRVGGLIYCIDDVCTHDGGPLGEGDLEDHCLVCPRHGAKFDVRTGDAVCMPATEPTATHDVRVDGDWIMVKLA